MNFTAHDVEQMIESQRAYYYTGATKPAEFRKAQLAQLKQSIKKYEPEVLEALRKDLGKSEFEAYSTEVGFVLDSITNMTKNLDEWMEPEQVKIPIYLQPANSFVMSEPYGSVLIIGPFNTSLHLMTAPLIGAMIGGK